MKERGILMSAPMVRAILAGTKTQTRRIVKPAELQRADDIEPHESYAGEWTPWIDGERRSTIECPYGVPGDRLWVRETFSGLHCMEKSPGRSAIPPAKWGRSSSIWYWADGDPADGDWTRPRPSIHMPRWASRITLEITDVRVERLQEIREEDAKAEGAEPFRLPVHPARESLRHVDGYAQLWDSINGTGSWDRNPWVWVVRFKRVS